MSKIIQVTPLSSKSIQNLTILYYPLMNRDAIVLYLLMVSFSDKEVEQEILLSMSSMNRTTFMKARKYLEQFHLLKTYRGQDRWLYHLYAPLEVFDFLEHDTFSRMLFQKIGSVRFDYIKTFFSSNSIVSEAYENVSEPTCLDSLNTWDDKKEEMHSSLLPKDDRFNHKYHFNYDEFLTGMDRIFPLRLRTKETMDQIGRLADIHGISAKDMKKYVMRSINPTTHYFDWNHLKMQIYRNQAKPVQMEGYNMPPVQFLSRLQNGAPVNQSDRKLIEALCTNYGFPNEVVNVLIEYTLKQTDQKFPKAYVEKVASTWARKGIDTKEKALNLLSSQPKKKEKINQKDYPEWYKNKEQHDASQELIDEVNAMLQGLGGNTNEE